MIERCLVCLAGMALASMFGIVMTAWYGPDALLSNPWIESVFWLLMASGALWILLTPVCGWLGHRCRTGVYHLRTVFGKGNTPVVHDKQFR